MGEFREIIRASRLERLENHQARADRFIIERLNEFKREIVMANKAAHQVLYQAFVAHTWRGRWKKLVAWIGKR